MNFYHAFIHQGFNFFHAYEAKK